MPTALPRSSANVCPGAAFRANRRERPRHFRRVLLCDRPLSRSRERDRRGKSTSAAAISVTPPPSTEATGRVFACPLNGAQEFRIRRTAVSDRSPPERVHEDVLRFSVGSREISSIPSLWSTRTCRRSPAFQRAIVKVACASPCCASYGWQKESEAQQVHYSGQLGPRRLQATLVGHHQSLNVRRASPPDPEGRGDRKSHIHHIHTHCIPFKYGRFNHSQA